MKINSSIILTVFLLTQISCATIYGKRKNNENQGNKNHANKEILSTLIGSWKSSCAKENGENVYEQLTFIFSEEGKVIVDYSDFYDKNCTSRIDPLDEIELSYKLGRVDISII